MKATQKFSTKKWTCSFSVSIRWLLSLVSFLFMIYSLSLKDKSDYFNQQSYTEIFTDPKNRHAPTINII